jgi:TonB family protein
MKKIFKLLLTFYTTLSFAQTSSTSPEFEAQVVGGKEHFEQVLQTQLSLPKTILTSNFDTKLTTFFDVDSTGKAINIKVDGQVNNVLRNELIRIFNFFRFYKTINLLNESRPYFLFFNLSTQKYNQYFKQKNKFTLKKQLPADSSYILFSKADKSPEYYKNGEDGLADFILTTIEYPKLAVEKSVQGTVIIEFVIETNGYITNINIKQGVNTGCSEEAIRLIKQTKWQPAIVNNKFVRYKTNYPITFSLRNNNKDNSNSGLFGQ